MISVFIRGQQLPMPINVEASGPEAKNSDPNSPYDFMQTRGKGLHESEVYTVLFRHTTCYELMPESAKLVTLDSMLPVGKAFRALCENGIRAAPVWNSETQTFSDVLTINDFLEMLTYCWRNLIGNNSSTSSGNSNSSALEASVKISIEELETMSIKKWKDIRSRLSTRRSSGMDQQETIHEEDENVSGSASSSDSEQSCSNSSGASRSSSIFNSTGEDRDVDWNSVASAPSQIGESDAPLPSKHPHSHTHYHHPKSSSVKGCDFLSIQGGKHSVRLKCHRTGGLTVIYPEDSLYSALRLLAHCKLHRLPVFDDPVCGSGNALFVLTHRSLLAYLYKKQIDLPRPKYLQAQLKEVGVGTYKNLSLVLPSTKLVDALAFFENETVSALPVVDSYANRRLLDIFAKFDVITLILAGKHRKPDMTVQDVLDICKQIHRGVIPIPEGQNKFDVEICLTTDTIQFALNKLMRTGYHRLIIVDNHINCRVEGVISISDLLYYMVLRPSPRGPIPSVHALDNKSSTETNPTYEEGTNPDWLFYSEQDPNAMGRNPCVPMVKGLPNCSDSNGKETERTTTRPTKQEIARLRMTSESSVTTGTIPSSRSTSSSTTSSSSTYSSSSSSSLSTSSTSSRSRSSSPAAGDRSNSRGLPKRAYVVDNRKGSDGKSRTKTLGS